MKMRTIYIKSKSDTAKTLVDFYSKLFNIEPKKHKNDISSWIEFDCGNINFAFLVINSDSWTGSNCVPVFEFPQDTIQKLKIKVRELGGEIIIENHDGFVSAVCKDPCGNEFEITSFHD